MFNFGSVRNMHVRKNLLKSKDFTLHVKTFKQELSQFQSVKESEN